MVSIAINLDQSILCLDNYYTLLFDLWAFLTPIHHCQTNLSRISLSWCYYPAQKFLMTAIRHLLKRFKFLSFVPTALSDQFPINLSSLCYYPELIDRTPQFQLVRYTHAPPNYLVFFMPPCFICSWDLNVPSSIVFSPSPFFECLNYNSVSLLFLSNFQNFWRMFSSARKPWYCHLSPWSVSHSRIILHPQLITVRSFTFTHCCCSLGVILSQAYSQAAYLIARKVCNVFHTA